MQLIIKPPRGYSLDLSVHSWIYRDVQPVPEVSWNGSLGRALTISKSSVSIMLSQEREGRLLETKWDNESISHSEIKTKIMHLLSLAVSITAALDSVKYDPRLKSILDRVHGVRPYLADTLFEALMKTIIQQQISYKAANVLTKRLVEKTVIPMRFEERDFYRFPTAKEIVEIGETGLRNLGLGYKAPYLVNICQMLLDGALDLEQLRKQPLEDVAHILTDIRGIGMWTVHVLAIAGLGDFTTFPYSDLGIRNLLQKLYGLQKKPSAKNVESLSESWGKGGPMVLYLLMCADVLGLVEEKSRVKTPKRSP